MDIGFQSSTNSASSTDQSTNQLSMKVSTNRFDLCALCVYKTHRSYNCPLIPEEQKRRLVQAKNHNTRGSQRGETNQYDVPRQIISTRRDFPNNRPHKKYLQHQRSQNRRNERSVQKNESGKGDKWSIPRPNPTEQPKKDPEGLKSEERFYFQRSLSC